MSRRTNLPEPYDAGSFGLSAAREAGVTARLRWMYQPFVGVRSHEVCADLSSRVAALQTVLPRGSAFCRSTSAQLLDLPAVGSIKARTRLEVMTPSDRPVTRREGISGHRGLESRRVITVNGLRVVAPVDTWLDLAAVHSLDDLIILGDAILAQNPALLDDLRAGVQRRAGTRGVTRAREAVELLRVGVRSPMETVTRLLVTRAGLPEPEINAEVTDSAHTWIAEVDLVWREQKVIVEYDGEWHGAPGQRRLDAVRRRQLRAEGWIVIELFADDVLRQPERAVVLVREALEGRVAS